MKEITRLLEKTDDFIRNMDYLRDFIKSLNKAGIIELSNELQEINLLVSRKSIPDRFKPIENIRFYLYLLSLSGQKYIIDKSLHKNGILLSSDALLDMMVIHYALQLFLSEIDHPAFKESLKNCKISDWFIYQTTVPEKMYQFLFNRLNTQQKTSLVKLAIFYRANEANDLLTAINNFYSTQKIKSNA